MKLREVFDESTETLLRLKDEDEPPLTKWKALVVRERRQIGSILKQLSDSFGQFKRVKHRGEESLVLLTADEATQFSPDAVIDVEVPNVLPVRNGQVIAWSRRYWPLSRLQNEVVDHISTADQAEISRWLTQLREIHRESHAQSTAIIVDRRSQTIVGLGHQGCKRLDHAAMVAIRDVGFKVATAKASGDASFLANDDTYLCSGFDVYLSHEPCPMCAMGLLHSRVRRVVFGEADVRRGALYSGVRLHTLPGINHRFQVVKWDESGLCGSGCYP